MKLFPSIIVPILLFAAPLAGFGQLYFVENKGQWDQQVYFKTEAGNSAFFLTKDGYSIRMNHPDDYLRLAEYNHGHSFDTSSKAKARIAPPDKMRGHAFRVKFLGGNFNSRPIMEKPLPGVENYFIGNDPAKWASNCRLFQAITYKDVYPHVDVRYYVQDDQLKYDVIVYPGADVTKIQMRYEGAEKLSIRNNELVVSTSVGEARELKPYTYQFVNGKRETVSNKYKITGNTVSFDVKAYNKSTTLIIDPSLVFSSFSRSTADNWGYTATYGADGSFFGGGTAQPTGFPVSPGAIQGTGGGGSSSNGGAPPDIAIIRLSADGRNRIYATYLGGNGLDQPHSLVADAAGNLVIAGRTNSGNTYPGTLVGAGGGYDIFVTKINATGTAIIGSLRIGGSGDDGVNISANRNGANSLQRFYGDDGRSEVILDGANNVLVASSTQSTNFPVQNGFQAASGGLQDAVLLKLNANATAVTWSTYMGGLQQDAGFVLSINPTNPSNIYVGGGTSSPNFPGSVAGVLQPTYNGGLTDGYLAQLQDNGASVSLIRSTFLGTPNIDIVYGVQFDAMGFPYVMGTTTGNWPVINAAYSVANSRQFIAKLQPNLSAFVYSTTFGTSGALNPNISPVAFLVDNCENVYVSGWGGGANNFGGNGYPSAGTTGLPVTPDAFQRNTDGSDFYFFVLQKNAASQLYGSYFGQLGGGGGLEHVDGGTSRFDANGTIYQAMCANCKNVNSNIPLSSPFPITAGVFGNINPAGSGGGCNLGMVKISFDLSGIDVALRAVGARQLNFCLPATVQFTDTIQEANQYIWIWGDGTPNDTTTLNPFTHTYNSTGFFDVKVIGIDSNSCNVKDSAFMRIRVTTDSVDLGFNFARQDCNSLNFQFTNTSNILTSTTPFGPRSFMWVWGDGSPNDTVPGFAPPISHTFPGIGSYNVRLVLIDSNYCNLGETEGIVDFQVIDLIRAGFTVSNVCVPDTISITDTSRGALTYLWVSSDGQTSTNPDPGFVYNSPGTYSITQYVYNPNSCNLVDSTTRTFQAVAPPAAGFFFNPNPSQENTPTRFTSTSSEDAIQWFWDFGDGNTSTQRDPIHQYLAPGINIVCQTVTNQAGCVDSVCIPVESIINVVNDLPSAFTPNGDGVNDVFSVRGFGITKMTLRVYNRQGLLVFESRSQNIGWDGKYKGIPQPMDAYGWTLEVEYFTGEKFRKKGDVTLIR